MQESFKRLTFSAHPTPHHSTSLHPTSLYYVPTSNKTYKTLVRFSTRKHEHGQAMTGPCLEKQSRFPHVWTTLSGNPVLPLSSIVEKCLKLGIIDKPWVYSPWNWFYWWQFFSIDEEIRRDSIHMYIWSHFLPISFIKWMVKLWSKEVSQRNSELRMVFKSSQNKDHWVQLACSEHDHHKTLVAVSSWHVLNVIITRQWSWCPVGMCWT